LIFFFFFFYSTKWRIGVSIPNLALIDNDHPRPLARAHTLTPSSAGLAAGEPLWRMPITADDRRAVSTGGSGNADLVNSAGRSAGACTAAAFLDRFVPPTVTRYAHLDIAGVMKGAADRGARVKGMTGRPTRALVQWCLAQVGQGK
jgi:leucyl aminopeptidase